MPSDFIQRQIDRLLEQASDALQKFDWPTVHNSAATVLGLDPDNADAKTLLALADGEAGAATPGLEASTPESLSAVPASSPASFASGRYAVKKFLGEGGKKKVYLAHDTTLDRDVAFALIKMEGLDDVGRDRVAREAKAMGRLGAHPHIVSVYDLGEENGQPFMVTELMGGGDVEELIEKASDHRPPIARTLEIGIATCRGLEFAHDQGIIHRDLKPGNVWLTADGVAKIGDFGLAVAIDKTRLTQAGMMVGTVNYMPPEQATGGEVTPRSDLYSLGAMVYEMVTGRPPFVGDEAVAIIGQHLNTPPVAPSWHNPDCPPGLEALILRLLEKDPNKRPRSAEEVRKALESVAQGLLGNLSSRPPSPRGKEEDENPQVTASDSPLYRRVFVGREQELKQLQAAFDAALSGRGALAMVVGEPGIGKTAVCEQLATYVTLRGGKTLVGHCYEEGSLSLPYLPFVEAMRSHVLAREPEGLQKDLGGGAGEVARIVSEVRDRVRVAPVEEGDAEEQRWRLLQAVTSFLRNASKVTPLLIVLEDLHDADRGTLDLLVHLGRSLDGARLLVVGTYRDVEVDRAHPLSGALAELRRGQNFLRVPLRGLTVDEVQRMMNGIRGQEVLWSRAEAIHRQTEGNPLFVQETLRYLAEEGGARPDEMTIPEGLRDVIGKRLSRLSERTNQVLAVAAVIGRDFRLDVLKRVLGLTEEDLTVALEEASATAIIETRAGSGPGVEFRFAHALFRQTLYEELFSLRRIRLHQQVARALEAVYGRRLEEHAAELAEHFAQSTEQEDMQKALHYSELAAVRAMAAYAYGEAARHLEQALKVQEVLDPDEKVQRCDLLLALGETMLPDENPERAATVAAPEAFALAEALGDSDRAAKAAVLALNAIARAHRAGGDWEAAGAGEWVKRAQAYAMEGTVEHVLAAGHRARYEMATNGTVAAHPFMRAAVEEAVTSVDDRGFYMPAALAIRFLQALQDRERRYLLAEGVLRRPRAGARSGDLGICLAAAAGIFLGRGDRDTAELLWAELEDLATRSRDASVRVLAFEPRVMRELMNGELEQSVASCSDWQSLSHQLGVEVFSTAFIFRTMATALDYLGRAEEALSLPDFASPTTRPQSSVRAASLAHAGRHSEARAIRERFANIDSDADETSTAILQNLFQAAILGGDRETARILMPRLTVLAGSVADAYTPVSCARLLGGAAKLLNEPEQARIYFEQAIEVCTKVRFRPELALSRLELAELLLEHYPEERAAAIEHLDFAIAEFREMRMQPSLERALRHKEVLKA
jgi:serine/threonine protein kinase